MKKVRLAPNALWLWQHPGQSLLEMPLRDLPDPNEVFQELLLLTERPECQIFDMLRSTCSHKLRKGGIDELVGDMGVRDPSWKMLMTQPVDEGLVNVCILDRTPDLAYHLQMVMVWTEQCTTWAVSPEAVEALKKL